MGLKQSIVIVNEFSVKTGSKGGTRGGTPGDYVLRYMARKGATEDLTPVRIDDNDAYVVRYMARREATEVYDSVSRVRDGIADAGGIGGVAFGSTGRFDDGDISMSDRKVRRVSKDIQSHFEDGKTVMKTVLSFDLAYLQEMGVVEKEFAPEQEGDYRGNIDQMKLREAIMHGMSKMSRHYDDLEWVGVIQVDTMHVHCHLCMVDKGRGNVRPDGTQRGKLTATDMRTLRRGVDDSLSDMQPVKMMASSIGMDRRNARCFIKKYTHETMAEHGLPQFLLACLPADRRSWRAASNAAAMRKPNAIVREYVEQVLAQPDSGYAEARRDIAQYADERASREDLTGEERRRLIRDGEERLIEDCMNGVYQVLARIPDGQRSTWTPFMDAMSMSYEEMATEQEDDPMIEFGFKLRSYSNRLQHHRKERHKWRDAKQSYEQAEEDGNVSEASRPLYEFYRIEEEYNAMLMAKYQHFLSFLPGDTYYADEFSELLDYRDRMRRMWLMMNDPSCKRMSPDSAEDYGVRVYDMHGGEYVSTNPSILERRFDAMAHTYERMEDDFKAHIADRGLSLVHEGDGMRLSRELPYDFDDVKALDLHHLGYDFPYDVPISKINADDFIEMAKRRSDAYLAATDYLRRTGQGEFIKTLPGRDVRLMREMAERMQQRPVLPSVTGDNRAKRGRARTVTLDDNYMKDMRLAVESTVQSMTMNE